MSEKPPSHHISVADLLALPVDPPQIDTPIIDLRVLARNDTEALDALEKLEKSLTRPPLV